MDHCSFGAVYFDVAYFSHGVLCHLVYESVKLVKPLELMTKASMQVQMGQFKHIQLDTESGNELGVLAKVFTQMSSELGRLYSRLEDAVNEKTQKLRQTNRSLTTLYQSSQLLTPTKINDKILSQVLNHIRVSEHLRYIELEIFGSEHWEISFGQKRSKTITSSRRTFY